MDNKYKSILKENTLPLASDKRRVSFAPEVTLHKFDLVPYTLLNHDTKRRRTMGMRPLRHFNDNIHDAGLEVLEDSSDDEKSSTSVEQSDIGPSVSKVSDAQSNVPLKVHTLDGKTDKKVNEGQGETTTKLEGSNTPTTEESNTPRDSKSEESAKSTDSTTQENVESTDSTIQEPKPEGDSTLPNTDSTTSKPNTDSKSQHIITETLKTRKFPNEGPNLNNAVETMQSGETANDVLDNESAGITLDGLLESQLESLFGIYQDSPNVSADLSPIQIPKVLRSVAPVDANEEEVSMELTGHLRQPAPPKLPKMDEAENLSPDRPSPESVPAVSKKSEELAPVVSKPPVDLARSPSPLLRADDDMEITEPVQVVKKADEKDNVALGSNTEGQDEAKLDLKVEHTNDMELTEPVLRVVEKKHVEITESILKESHDMDTEPVLKLVEDNDMELTEPVQRIENNITLTEHVQRVENTITLTEHEQRVENNDMELTEPILKVVKNNDTRFSLKDAENNDMELTEPVLKVLKNNDEDMELTQSSLKTIRATQSQLGGSTQERNDDMELTQPVLRTVNLKLGKPHDDMDSTELILKVTTITDVQPSGVNDMEYTQVVQKVVRSEEIDNEQQSEYSRKEGDEVNVQLTEHDQEKENVSPHEENIDKDNGDMEFTQPIFTSSRHAIPRPVLSAIDELDEESSHGQAKLSPSKSELNGADDQDIDNDINQGQHIDLKNKEQDDDSKNTNDEGESKHDDTAQTKTTNVTVDNSHIEKSDQDDLTDLNHARIEDDDSDQVRENVPVSTQEFVSEVVTTSKTPLAELSVVEEESEDAVSHGEPTDQAVSPPANDEGSDEKDTRSDGYIEEIEDSYVPVSLSTFMNDVGVGFFDDLGTDVNVVSRMSLTANTSFNEPELSDYLLCLPKLAHLGLFQFCCEELQHNIQEGIKVISEFNDTIAIHNPPLFREYYLMDEFERPAFGVKLNLLKDFTKSESKITWYDWRSQLTQNLIEELKIRYSVLEEDRLKLLEDISKLDSIIADAEEQLHHLEDKLRTVLSFKEQFKSIGSGEQLYVLKNELVGIGQHLQSVQEDLDEKRAKLAYVEHEIEEQYTRQKALQFEKAQAEREVNNNRIFKNDELEPLLFKSKALMSVSGLKYESIEGKTMYFIFDDIVRFSVNFEDVFNVGNIEYMLVDGATLHNKFLLSRFQSVVSRASGSNVFEHFKLFKNIWSVYRKIDEDVYRVSLQYPIEFLAGEELSFRVRYYNFQKRYKLQVLVTINDITEYPNAEISVEGDFTTDIKNDLVGTQLGVFKTLA